MEAVTAAARALAGTEHRALVGPTARAALQVRFDSKPPERTVFDSLLSRPAATGEYLIVFVVSVLAMERYSCSQRK